MWKKGKFLERLRGDIVDESVSLTTVLRKAKVLASALENEPFQNWVDSELNGYVGKEDLPEYRMLYTQSVGTFIGPFAKMDNQVIPASHLPEILREFATVINLRNPVKELEGMSRPAQEMYKRRWPAEAVILARDHIELSGTWFLLMHGSRYPRMW